MRFLVDLHNHSCLSPCATLEQSPAVLARRARERGISVLGLSDHNAALNCAAFAECCRREGLAPLFGIEACGREEVHVLCVFGRVEEAEDFGSWLRERLPALPYDPDRLGDQVVVDADENVLELPGYFLGTAVDAGFDDICEEGAARGALVIPAHVDRPYYSVSSQLGFLPPGPYDAVESIREPDQSLRGSFSVVSGSDAHAPEQVGRRPFAAELDADAVAAAAASPGGGAGAALLRSLRGALRRGTVSPYWAGPSGL